MSGEFQFELEAIDPCLSSILKIYEPGNLIYTIGEGNIIIPFKVEASGPVTCRNALEVEFSVEAPEGIIFSSIRFGESNV